MLGKLFFFPSVSGDREINLAWGVSLSLLSEIRRVFTMARERQWLKAYGNEVENGRDYAYGGLNGRVLRSTHYYFCIYKARGVFH